jgi:prevent-host-death family protein
MEEQNEVIEIEKPVIEELVSRAEQGGSVILTRGGEPVAAVIAIDALRTLTDERELLRRLALGELESAAGEGEQLEAVLEDCRLLLEEN